MAWRWAADRLYALASRLDPMVWGPGEGKLYVVTAVLPPPNTYYKSADAQNGTITFQSPGPPFVYARDGNRVKGVRGLRLDYDSRFANVRGTVLVNTESGHPKELAVYLGRVEVATPERWQTLVKQSGRIRGVYHHDDMEDLLSQTIRLRKEREAEGRHFPFPPPKAPAPTVTPLPAPPPKRSSKTGWAERYRALRDWWAR